MTPTIVITRGCVAALGLLCALAAPARAQVLRFAELDAGAVGRLDRARTVVIIPGGILEQHGPLIPVNADGYRNDRVADSVAAAVAARRGWIGPAAA